MRKRIYLYVLDTMADWECGYLLQGLAMQAFLPESRYELRTVGAVKEPVRTLGGVTVLPDCGLDEVRLEETAALLLPGADQWAEDRHQAALGLAEQLLDQGGVVAAICGATLALAERGLLDRRAHTSNSPAFLTGLSRRYQGSSFYREELAVADEDLITAGSAGGLLWARMILERLALYAPDTVEAWYQYYLAGDARYYMELMESFPQK